MQRARGHWLLIHQLEPEDTDTDTDTDTDADTARIQPLPNWTLKGTGCPKASGRLSPTNNNNNDDYPLFMEQALLSICYQLPFGSQTHSLTLLTDFFRTTSFSFEKAPLAV